MTTREQLWLRAYESDVKKLHPETAAKNADAVLAEFDKRFPQVEAPKDTNAFCACGSNSCDQVPGGFRCRSCGRFIPVKEPGPRKVTCKVCGCDVDHTLICPDCRRKGYAADFPGTIKTRTEIVRWDHPEKKMVERYFRNDEVRK